MEGGRKRLASLLSKRDPEINAFLGSSYLSRRVALQVLGNGINSGGWCVNLSNRERPEIEVSLHYFLDEPREYEKLNTVVLYWPGFSPRVVVDCVGIMRGGLGMDKVSWLEIYENYMFDQVVERIPIQILVLDYTNIFFPNASKGLPPNAFQRIRSRCFKCSVSSPN